MAALAVTARRQTCWRCLTAWRAVFLARALTRVDGASRVQIVAFEPGTRFARRR